MNDSYTYILGDHAREAARLRAQERLWDPVSRALFDRVGVRPGWKVLEVGPGQGSLHSELRRRVQGPVDAVERSPIFAARLRTLAGRDGFGPDRIWESDVIDTVLPKATYDLIFARWVFLFLPNPGTHVKLLARALKPGGLLAIQDYYFETYALVPRPPEWTSFLAALRSFLASEGGDASIGGSLPTLYRRAGLEVAEIKPTMKWGHPGSPVWDWVTTYFMDVVGRLATFPPFDARQAARLRRRWHSAARDRASLLIGPALLDVVGRKPRSKSRPRRSA